MPGEKAFRLFFALWPQDVVRAQIHQRMREHAPVAGGRTVPASNFHVTVFFLGSVPVTRLDAVHESGARASAAAEAFDLSFDRIESWARSKVQCLTASITPPALTVLADRLRFNLLEPRGAHDHELRPHVTLLRHIAHPHPVVQVPPVSWHVDALALIDSRSAKDGSIYTVIGRWPLRTPSTQQVHDVDE